MPGFGRRFDPDDRDRNYLMRRMLPDVRRLALPTRKTWRIAPRALHQGNTGTCVGHAWSNFLRCAPLQTTKGPSAFDIYRAAILTDPFSENDDEAELPDGDGGLEFGTTVRAGAEAVTGFRRLKSYVWAFSLAPAVEWVLTRGPVVLGTNWYSSFRPDAEGIIRILPNARVAGGHAYLLRGVDTRRALARCSNSWGDDWGSSGDFLLPFRDLERLIHEDGEVCSAVEKRLQADAVMPPPQAAFIPDTSSSERVRTSGRQEQRRIRAQD
jgi:hypothetical protein